MTYVNKPEVCSSQAIGEPDLDQRNTETKRFICSDKLLEGKRELMIQHCGEIYHLRITSKGKLILTK